jgi:hypothetical protein
MSGKRLGAPYRLLPLAYKVAAATAVFIGVLLVLEPFLLRQFGRALTMHTGPSLSLSALAIFVGTSMILVVFITIGKRRFATPDYQGEQAVGVDIKGLMIRSGNPPVSLQVNWPWVAEFAESQNLFLLVASRWQTKSAVAGRRRRHLLYMIPKRAFTQIQVVEFRKLVQSNVLQK